MHRSQIERRVKALMQKSVGVGGFTSVAGAGAGGGGLSTSAMVNRAAPVASMIQTAGGAAALIASGMSNGRYVPIGNEAKLQQSALAAAQADLAAQKVLAEQAAERARIETELQRARAEAAAAIATTEVATATVRAQNEAQAAEEARILAQRKRDQEDADRATKEARRAERRTEQLRQQAAAVASAADAATALQASGAIESGLTPSILTTQIMRQSLANDGVALNSPEAQELAQDVATDAVAKLKTAQAGVGGGGALVPIAIIGVLGLMFLGRKKRAKP